MAKTIHVHVHGKTKDDSSYKGYSIKQNYDWSAETKKMEPIFQIYGPQATKRAFKSEQNAKTAIDKYLSANNASSAGDIRKQLKETPYPAFGSPLTRWSDSAKDEAPCFCKSHAKDAKRFVVGGMITLKNGKQAKVLEESETRVKVQEGGAERWVDLTEIQMPKAKDANPDGTISPDEDQRRKALVQKALSDIENWKREAKEIGGSFRSPGIMAEIKRAVQGKL
jgi:hypothetical protein